MPRYVQGFFTPAILQATYNLKNKVSLVVFIKATNEKETQKVKSK